MICRLVAHHTGAAIEAEERNLPGYIDEFAHPDDLLLEALTYCDMTSAVDGEPTDVDQRIAEILTRYPEGHVVHRSITKSAPMCGWTRFSRSALAGECSRWCQPGPWTRRSEAHGCLATSREGASTQRAGTGSDDGRHSRLISP
jgi:hypothetical protein